MLRGFDRLSIKHWTYCVCANSQCQYLRNLIYIPVVVKTSLPPFRSGPVSRLCKCHKTARLKCKSDMLPPCNRSSLNLAMGRGEGFLTVFVTTSGQKKTLLLLNFIFSLSLPYRDIFTENENFSCGG